MVLILNHLIVVVELHDPALLPELHKCFVSLGRLGSLQATWSKKSEIACAESMLHALKISNASMTGFKEDQKQLLMDPRACAVKLLWDSIFGCTDVNEFIVAQLQKQSSTMDISDKVSAFIAISAYHQANGRAELALQNAQSAVKSSKGFAARFCASFMQQPAEGSLAFRLADVDMMRALYWLITCLFNQGNCELVTYYLKKGIKLAEESGAPYYEALFQLKGADFDLHCNNFEGHELRTQRLRALLDLYQSDTVGVSSTQISWSIIEICLKLNSAQKSIRTRKYSDALGSLIALKSTSSELLRKMETGFPSFQFPFLVSKHAVIEMEVLFTQFSLGMHINQQEASTILITSMLPDDHAHVMSRHTQVFDDADTASIMPNDITKRLSKKAEGTKEILKTTVPEIINYDQMKVAELKAMLKEHGLPLDGKKDVLIKRLAEHLATANKLVDADDSDQSDDDDCAPIPFSLELVGEKDTGQQLKRLNSIINNFHLFN
jgi:hypothetical protein